MATFKQKIQFAYSLAGVGSLALGGESAAAYPIYDWNIDGDSYEGSVVTIDFGVTALGLTDAARDADFQERLLALANLEYNDGDVGITGTAEFSFTNISGTIAAGVLTIVDDDAGGQFADTQLGLPIDIEGVGSFAITGRTDTNTVTCQLPPELTPTANFTGKNARIGYDIFRVHHASVTGGYFARTSVSELPSEVAGRTHRSYRLTVRVEQPATDTVNDPGGRRHASIGVSQGFNDLQVLNVDVVYTPTKASETTNLSARVNFVANVDTYAATVTLGLGGTWKKLDRAFSEPDSNGTLRGRLRFSEQNFPDTASSFVDDATIRNAVVSFRRVDPVQFGLAQTAPVEVEITYSAWIPKATATWDGLLSVYQDTIKRHLLDSVETEFGGSSILIGESFQPIVSSNQIVARMRVFVRPSSSILEFDKFIVYNLDTNIDTFEKYSGVQHDYREFTATPVVSSNVTARIVRLGAPVNDNVDIMKGPQTPSGDQVNASISTGWQVPGQPPFPDDIIAGDNPQWLPRPAFIRHRPGFWGYDIDRKSKRVMVTESLYSLNWLWGTAERIGFVQDLEPFGPEIDPEDQFDFPL